MGRRKHFVRSKDIIEGSDCCAFLLCSHFLPVPTQHCTCEVQLAIGVSFAFSRRWHEKRLLLQYISKCCTIDHVRRVGSTVVFEYELIASKNLYMMTWLKWNRPEAGGTHCSGEGLFYSHCSGKRLVGACALKMQEPVGQVQQSTAQYVYRWSVCVCVYVCARVCACSSRKLARVFENSSARRKWLWWGDSKK